MLYLNKRIKKQNLQKMTMKKALKTLGWTIKAQVQNRIFVGVFDFSDGLIVLVLVLAMKMTSEDDDERRERREVCEGGVA